MFILIHLQVAHLCWNDSSPTSLGQNKVVLRVGARSVVKQAQISVDNSTFVTSSLHTRVLLTACAAGFASSFC